MGMNDPKETDYASTLRRFSLVRSPERSMFKMSKRNKEKWALIRKRVEQLKGGR